MRLTKTHWPFTMILLLCFHLSAKAQDAQFIGFRFLDEEKTKVSIPFTLQNNLVIIPVVVNDAIPLHFVVDTGVRTAIITDRSYTDLLKVDYVRRLTMVGADGITPVNALVAQNISLRLPGVIGTAQSVLVLEEDYLLLSKTLGSDVHGIIGYELFSRYVVELDYQTSTMTLHDPRHFKPKKRFSVFDLSIEDTKPYMQARVELQDSTEVNCKLLIDTGASHAMLLHLGAHPDFKLPSQVIPANLGRGLGGNITGHFGRVGNLRFGKYTFPGAIVSFASEDNYSEVYQTTARQGSLGGGITSRFHTIIDYFNEKIYLRKNRQYRRKFEYNMSGIQATAREPYYDRIYVQEVAPGSVAASAGVEQGDEIVLINGRHAPSFGITAINNLFRSKVNKRIKMRVRRNGRIQVIRFDLQRVL